MKKGRKIFLIILACIIFIPMIINFFLSLRNFTAPYIEINLNDKTSINPFEKPARPLEVYRIIEKAAKDDVVQGIVLNISSISRNRDYLWGLRTALEEFKLSGKSIVAFISNADIDIYNLASVADKIVMDDLGVLTMFGYSINSGYVKQTLEKIGIGVRELRYFEYKSAAESFTRTSMSDADRRQNNDYLDDIFNLTRKTLMSARGWTEQEFNTILNREFMYSARSAQRRGIVDYVGRKNAVLKAISDIEGSEITDFCLYGESSSSLTGAELPYTVKKARGAKSVIAVVYAEGQTDMERGIEAIKISKTIVELANNNGVSAIIVRMNSPGGSAEAADYIAEAIRYAKFKKPVVVSMGQVAASGGYWAAVNASHIMASPYTITGSIGVIGTWFYDDGLNSKLGLTSDRLQRGDHADLMTGNLMPYRDLTSLEEERYKSYILDIYDVFIEKVAVGRGMEKQKVEAAAQGRIYSGTRALNVGLIDSIGNLSDAMRTARTLAEIPEEAGVNFKEYPEPKLWESVLSNLSVITSVFAKNKTDPSNHRFVTDLAEKLLPYSDIIYRLENNGKVMPILPLEFLY